MKPTAQPTTALCFCGATARNTMHEASFDYPSGWTAAKTATPETPPRHAGMLVCAVCPD